MRYFFDLDGDGQFTEDETGSDCDSLDQMRQKARALLAEVAAFSANHFDGYQLSARVRDDVNTQVYRAILTIRGEKGTIT